VRPVAEKEAKRGTSDPTYLVYTMAAEILKLRDDYKKLKGGKLNCRLSTTRSCSRDSSDQDRAARLWARFTGAVGCCRRCTRGFSLWLERQRGFAGGPA